MGSQFNTGGRVCVCLFDQSTELWAKAAKDQFTEKERATDTIIGLLQVYEGCIKWVTKMFCLVNEGVGDKNVISAPTALCECTLERVGDICVLHKLHKAGVEGACEELS